MKVFFMIIFVILLFIVITYLALIIKVKINITIDEAVASIRFKILKFHKDFVFRFSYLDFIKKYFIRGRKKKVKFVINRLDLFKSLIKAFFIKNIDIHSELFEEKFSLAVEFNVVNIITKRGVLSE